jgi:hypothetical protein
MVQGFDACRQFPVAAEIRGEGVTLYGADMRDELNDLFELPFKLFPN